MNDELHDDLRMAIMRLGRRMRLERVDGDVTDGQLSVLFTLAKDGPQTLSALSEADRVTPPSMNRTVNALEEARLVSRAGAPDDGRKVLVALTDTGRSIVAETKRRRAAWFDRQLENLSPDDLATLESATGVLRRLADS